MQAQIITFKTDNQIFSDFTSLVNEALTAFNVTNWQVRQLKQALKINVLSPSIFISIISNNQLGRQYYKKSKQDSFYIKKNNKKQEITIRFSALRTRLLTDTTTTYNSEDVLQLIASYIQSTDGITSLSNLGYAQYRSANISNPDFVNDSDNFEFMPYFDITFLYTNSWQSQISNIESVSGNIYKI